MINVWHDPAFLSNLSDPFSALAGTAQRDHSTDDDRNVETPDLVRTKRARRKRRADPALVAQLRAGVDAARAARAAVEREERRAEERAALRDDPVKQAQRAELEAERAAARAARAARLARERDAGAKSASLWASRDTMLDARAKVGWRVRHQHEPFPAWGRMVRSFAGAGELDAAREAASLAHVFERFVAFARRKLHEALTRPERAVLERLMALDPEGFTAYSLTARAIMDE